MSGMEKDEKTVQRSKVIFQRKFPSENMMENAENEIKYEVISKD